MRKRADDVAETRQRIVEAAVRLHGTIGPAATTVSALAAEAAVTRLTVYRHFPDDLTLFSACSQHWAADQTFPDPERWKLIDDGEVRVTTGLTDVYRFYREAEPMLTNVRRDQAFLPEEIRERTAATEQSYCDALVSGFPARGQSRELVRATLHHAISYWTWHSLCLTNRIKNEEAVRLMTALVMAASRSKK